MSTFYKYAERNVADMVDWSVIGKNFTDMLKTESELREKKKADIEKSTTDTLQSLADSPTGLDKGVNENILNFSAQSQNYLLMMNRLLRSGQLDPKDYSIYTQNLKSGTGKVFSAAKAYQENYAKNIERANAKGLKRASAEELWNRQQAEDAANFSKSQLYINNNGNVSVGLPTIDPATGQYVLNNDPNTYKNPEQLHYASSVDIDPYDVDGAVKGIVDTFGKNIIAEAKLQNRFVVSVEDITNRAGYEDAEKNLIKGALAGNSSYGASILTDWINSEEGKKYSYTSNPNDPRLKTNEAILMVADPTNPTSGRMVPQLKPEQEARAEKFMKERVRAALDKEIKVQYQQAPQPQEWQSRRADDKKEKETALNAWGKVFTGATPAEKNAAKQQLIGTDRALKAGLVDIDFTSSPGEVIFKYSKESGRPDRTVPFDANSNTLMDWNMLGTEIHGVEDIGTVMKRSGGGSPNARMTAAQRNFEGIGGGREQKKDAGAVFTEHINAIPSSTFEKKDAAAANELAKYLKNTGVTVVPKSKYSLYNEVTLKYGDASITLNANENTDDAEVQATNLKSWLEKNVPAAVKQSLVDKGIIGAAPEPVAPKPVAPKPVAPKVNYGKK